MAVAIQIDTSPCKHCEASVGPVLSEIVQAIRAEFANQTQEIVAVLARELHQWKNEADGFNGIDISSYPLHVASPPYLPLTSTSGTSLGRDESKSNSESDSRRPGWPSVQPTLRSSGSLATDLGQDDFGHRYSEEHLEQCRKNPKRTRPSIFGGALPKGSVRHTIKRNLNSRAVENTIGLLILANAAMFGFQASHAIANPQEELPPIFEISEWIFIAVFTLELLARLVAYQLAFFYYTNPDFSWNVADLMLVVIAYCEALLAKLVAANMSTARLARFLRLFRIMRVFRLLRVLKDMRIMVLSILGTLKPMFWALVLLFLIIYTFAIVLQQLIEDDMSELRKLPHFESFTNLMYALFMSISGGVNYSEVVEPIRHITMAIPLLYGLYVAFVSFCVLNIVTGFFVDKASRMSQEDDENMLIQEIESRKKWMNDIESVFKEVDVDGSGEITLEEFVTTLKDLRIETLLKSCRIDVSRGNLRNIWEMLDFDQSGKIDIREFTQGLQQIHGDAKGIDVARIAHDVKKINLKLNEIMKLEDNLVNLTEAFKTLSLTKRTSHVMATTASSRPEAIQQDVPMIALPETLLPSPPPKCRHYSQRPRLKPRPAPPTMQFPSTPVSNTIE